MKKKNAILGICFMMTLLLTVISLPCHALVVGGDDPAADDFFVLGSGCDNYYDWYEEYGYLVPQDMILPDVFEALDFGSLGAVVGSWRFLTPQKGLSNDYFEKDNWWQYVYGEDDEEILVQMVMLYPELMDKTDVVTCNKEYYRCYESKNINSSYFPYQYRDYQADFFDGTSMMCVKKGADIGDGVLWDGKILYRYDADGGQLDSIQFVCDNLFIFIRMANAEQCFDIEALAPFLDARTAAQAVDDFEELIKNPPTPEKDAGLAAWLLPVGGAVLIVVLGVGISLLVRRKRKARV